MLPCDLNTARIRVLYRIPNAPARGRALDLSAGGNSILREKNWAGEFSVVDMSGADYAQTLPFADGAFDIVVLHRTLDRLAASARRERSEFIVADFLSQVARILASGGLAIGCVENRHGLANIVRRTKRLFGSNGNDADGDPTPPLSVPGCHRALVAAGFMDINLFIMLPGPDNPSRVLSIERGWSRRACKRQVQTLRPPMVSVTSYIAWRLLAELGISQYLGAATFFWGRKPC